MPRCGPGAWLRAQQVGSRGGLVFITLAELFHAAAGYAWFIGFVYAPPRRKPVAGWTPLGSSPRILAFVFRHAILNPFIASLIPGKRRGCIFPPSLTLPTSDRDGVWSFFLERAVRNLHVVLCMSPEGDALRNRCRNFPGLVGSTTIDWVFPWPQQALFAVAKVFLTDHPKVGGNCNRNKTLLRTHLCHACLICL